MPSKFNNVITVEATCKVHKIVACAARTSSNETLACNVTKSTELLSVQRLTWGYGAGTSGDLYDACVAAYDGAPGDKCNQNHNWQILNPSNATKAILLFVNTTNPSDVCTNVVQLL